MKKLFFVFAASALVFSSCGGEKKDEGIRLTFNPEKSKEVKSTYEFTVVSGSNGETIHFTIQMSGSAQKNEEGNIVLSLKNDNISMNGTLSGKQIAFDAAHMDSVPDSLRKVTNSVFSLYNKTFRGIYDERMNKISESIVQDGSGTKDSAENKMQFFIRFPDTTITPGYSWERELVIKSGNKMNCSARYTIKEIKDGKAVVTMEGKLTGDGETFGYAFNIDGALTGTIVVDIATGWAIDTDIKQQFTLEMEGQKTPMEFNIKHTISF